MGPDEHASKRLELVIQSRTSNAHKVLRAWGEGRSDLEGLHLLIMRCSYSVCLLSGQEGLLTT